MRSEYKRSDFKVLVRGKYAAKLRENLNVVVLDPDIADVFPYAASVNAALRALADIARRAGPAPQNREGLKPYLSNVTTVSDPNLL